MDSTPHIENETVTEWRGRLPEVPLAVPEEGEPFRVALPRALVTGAAVAVVGGAAWTLISILLNSLDVFVKGYWVTHEEMTPSRAIATLILGVVTFATTVIAFLTIAGWAGAKYGRLTYLRANNSAAMRIGVVLAGVGTAAMVWLLKSLARNRGLLPPLPDADVWNDYVMLVLSVVAGISVWLIFVSGASSRYHHRRRYCLHCGGLMVCKRELPLSAATAEQIATAVRNGSLGNWPDLSADPTEEDPEGLGFKLLVYRCEGCEAGLVEGETSVLFPERHNDWDVKWHWLSAVYSPEETAALEATLPRLGIWDRLSSWPSTVGFGRRGDRRLTP